MLNSDRNLQLVYRTDILVGNFYIFNDNLQWNQNYKLKYNVNFVTTFQVRGMFKLQNFEVKLYS